MEHGNKLFIARDGEQEHNHLFLYRSEPSKNVEEGIWRPALVEPGDSYGPVYFALPDKWFPEVKWSDEKATEVTLSRFVKYKMSRQGQHCSECSAEFICPGNQG